MSAENFETRLSEIAHEFPYPPAPRITTRRATTRVAPTVATTVRRWQIAGAVALLTIALLAVPQVRASLLEFIQIGAIRINLIQPTAMTTPTGTTPPTPTPLASILDLAGETTFEAAQSKAGFTLLLPDGFGQPQHVFYQDLGAPVVVLVWMNEDGSVRLSLHEIGPGSWAVPPLGKNFEKQMLTKYGYELINITDVGNTYGLWVQGERQLIARDGEVKSVRLVDSPALIWELFGMTYRLEGDFTLEEMVTIAESLK
ncbi:MAG: hypothetical protein ACT4QE_00590 [Anaerolineales bacterium]